MTRRVRNRGMSETEAARRRAMIFSNGRKESAQWRWKGKPSVELNVNWPRQWDYAGVAREIRYTSDKIMPENPQGEVEEYIHDTAIGQGLESGSSTFRRAEPFVEVYTPRGACDFGDPANVSEINRRSHAKNGAPRFPTDLAFLAECDGWSICPPNVRAPCGPSKAIEAIVKDCMLCCSPEGDMLVIFDMRDKRGGVSVATVWVGPSLVVGKDGLDD